MSLLYFLIWWCYFFYKTYLKELFRAKNIHYSKRNPGEVLKPYYLEQLLARIQDKTHHLPSFQASKEFCHMIKTKL